MITKLTTDQIAILEKCAEWKSSYVAIVWFKGRRYLFSAKGERHELDADSDVVKPLFDTGYLQETGIDTCILTDAGRCALMDVQNQAQALKEGVRG